jgi:hypothetical protein
MKSVLLPLLGLLSFGLVPSVTGAVDDIYGPLDPKDVELQVEQPQESICPFQAIRLRCTLRNISKATLNRAVLLDNGVALWIKGPYDKAFSRPPQSILLFPKGRPTNPSSASGMYNRVPLFLEPGEKTSVSFAFAASWRTQEGAKLPDDQGEPIFAEPGTYLVKCDYCVDNKQNKLIEKVLKVHVRVPGGQDKAVYDLLKNDRQLTSVLMRPVDTPAKETVSKLKEIIEKFPESSYVPYARFALARAYLNGLGLDTASSRVRRAFAGDELEAVIKHGYDAQAKKIIPNTFPYRPNALVLLSHLDAHERLSALNHLRCDHPESLECIEEFASLLLSSGTHRGRYEAEQLVGRFPPEDPILSPDDAKTRAFIDDKWRSFRKR